LQQPTLELRTCVDESSLLPTSQNGSPHDGRESFRGKGKPSLETMAKRGMLPTMTRADAGAGARDLTKPKNGMTLRLWPTATASMGCLARPSRPTPTARDEKGPGPAHTKGGRDLSTDVGGHLNPQWVEWLMGFPVGWTDVEGAAAYARSATRSSPSAHKSSGKSSDK